MIRMNPLLFSIIIPLYNRPQEIAELLGSLRHQQYRDFEVIVVDDGSQPPAREVVEDFSEHLTLRYFYIPNGGQGFARNYGFREARGDYFIVFDSDCLIPEDYLQIVADGLAETDLDAFGGPDAAHPSFTVLQKAISYAMTSPLTTGGIRGNKRHLGVFHPRSFNMGISRATWEKTGGFRWANKGEDMEFSMRMQEQGLKVGLLPKAKVYHKRRGNWRQFFKQIFSFGQGRVQLSRHFDQGLKLIHILPALFTLGILGLLLLFLILILLPASGTFYSTLLGIGIAGASVFMAYSALLFAHSCIVNKSAAVAWNSVIAVFVQFFAYGCGFILHLFKTTAPPTRK